MAVTNPARRELVFRQLDEIVEDVRSLQANGYRSVGNWKLAQACSHINAWARFPMDGFPKPFFPVRIMLWMMKLTIGRKQLQTVLETGSMKEGSPTMPATVAAPNAQSDDEAVENLVQTIDRLTKYDGPWHSSPLFGEMDKETVTQLTLVHAAHHLSFLIPTS